VIVENSRTLTATIDVPSSFQGALDLLVIGPGGSSSEILRAVQAIGYETAAWDLEGGRFVPVVDPAAIGFNGAQATALDCPHPVDFCSATDSVSILSPPSGCAGPTAYTARGAFRFSFRDANGNVIGQNCPTGFKLKAVQLSGGHCHSDANRPVGTYTFRNGMNTGPDGLQFIVDHTWPQVGGQIDVYFWSTSPSCPFYNDSTTARYIFCLGSGSFFAPGHAIFGPGAGDTLIGATTEHPDNHIGVPAMLDSLTSLGSAWTARFPSGPALGYNDLSLVWGGVFDLSVSEATQHPWVSPRHCGHRAGMEMDLRIINLNGPQLRIAEKLIKQRKFIIKPEGVPPHWHLKFYGAGTYHGPGSTVP
jgi:hypothetical protein